MAQRGNSLIREVREVTLAVQHSAKGTCSHGRRGGLRGDLRGSICSACRCFAPAWHSLPRVFDLAEGKSQRFSGYLLPFCAIPPNSSNFYPKYDNSQGDSGHM